MSAGKKQKASMTFVCAYDYTDQWGDRLIFQKVRYATNDLRGKTFLIRRPDPTAAGGWDWHPPAGWERYLFRLPQVWWAVQHGDDVFWAEGEKDALSLEAAGVVATTHGGAGNAHRAQAEWFRGHEARVLLVMDRDAAGIGAADVVQRYDLLRDVGLNEQQLLILAPRGDAKDVTDHLTAGYGVQDLRMVHRADVAQVAAQVTPAAMRAHGYWPAR
jgi:hypothetical protein